MSVLNDPNRIGVMVKRRGTWRETVEFYAAHRGLGSECLAHFDKLIIDGWIPAWAALRALDDYSCTDIIVDNQASTVQKRSVLN